MNQTFKKALCCGMAVMMFALSGCSVIDSFKSFIGLSDDPAPTPTPKPQVTVEYGTAEAVTLDLQEGVPTSKFSAENFSWVNGRMTYTDENAVVMTGIDVSEHQQYPDWDKVAADGIDFAMIRLGYRGSSEGMLYKDPIFTYNMKKAANAGLDIGIYFFSQATCRAEAVAEAYYVCSILEEYKDVITMPVVFDWEVATGENSRTASIDGDTVTKCAYYFSEIIAENGYQPAVYFNRHMGYYLYDLTRFTGSDVEFWFAGEGDYSDFYYEHSMWQYTFTGKVNGIEGDVDINLYIKYPEAASDLGSGDAAEGDTTGTDGNAAEGDTTGTDGVEDGAAE
ncbi:MAG: hypothetical protein J6J04_04935 [Oscillospiraceae bacterium]|nr:hypothetical protein [Oscillospiraceae bacterium]